ncbi:APA family basic amino acid/polyamine antiporter [Clostridium acetobutylicum]|nr:MULTISPECIES: amino acid permease [Clostridium]ADZ21815.1 amino acid permease-associated region [Clostridium acetobutylicum EA 2018]AEI32538.1 amino acid transporter [Clostridium acetobutylicum DSM 1731]AWV78872.1 amino acid permease [Clostridium acetobutylicum]MBC2395109.1 amino acid permease [Clostridium acetobutylicum]MBC2585105.1 amino acid permease [Clostridium acetobutylicum]
MKIFRKKSLDKMMVSAEKTHLKKTLKTKDIAALGIGAVVGVGIFVATGTGAHKAGPGIIISFLLAGIVACLCGLCYSELATMFPVSGSTYSYAYITFGEIVAMIVGWCLTSEYLVACSAVASGWSGTFIGILKNAGIVLPKVITASPSKGGIVDLPAVLITLILTYILYYGMKESSRVNNIIVIVKIAIIVMFLVLGATHIKMTNYKPFAPFGFKGIFAGASVIFFSYIGFDAISTTAEEAENPGRDVSRGLIICLAVVSILYISVAFVLTGMVHYDKIVTEDAVPAALASVGIRWGSALVGIGAILGMISTMIAVLYGQIRVFMVMSRDGLIPKALSKVHPKHNTPYVATVITGVTAAIIAGFLPLDIITNFLSIGTLLSFSVVSLAVVVLRYKMPNMERKFKCPGVPFTPIITIICCIILLTTLKPITWIAFLGWLLVGILVYIFYGSKHSSLEKEEQQIK